MATTQRVDVKLNACAFRAHMGISSIPLNRPHRSSSLAVRTEMPLQEYQPKSMLHLLGSHVPRSRFPG